ncbi:MAG: hypothetical protein D6790_02240, partial [Caldilineae bacterium]
WGVLVTLLLLVAACQGGASPSGAPDQAALALPGPSLAAFWGHPVDVADLAPPPHADIAYWDASKAVFPTLHPVEPEEDLEREFADEIFAARPPMTEWEGLGDGPLKRTNFFLMQRAYPLDTLPVGGYAARVAQTQRLTPLEAAETLPKWQNIGPASMLNSSMGAQKVNTSGRVTALVVDPRDSDVVYLGAAQGGVWKTTDGGDSWTPLTDDQPSLAVGAIALDPKNPDIVYVGTGEPTSGLDNYYGAGILKSTDAGQTWTRLGADAFGGMGIARILVNPNDTKIVYAASSMTGTQGPAQPPRGVFRSNDGGQTWKSLLSCSNCFGASDLEMDPRNVNVLYASFWGYGVYKSTDGGDNWGQLLQGLPDPQQFRVGRVILTISPSNPSILYASYQVTVPGQYDGALVFKTTDGGASWTQISTGGYNYCGQQCWYSHTFEVSPNDPNVVYAGGMANYTTAANNQFVIRQVVVKSPDSGGSWQ